MGGLYSIKDAFIRRRERIKVRRDHYEATEAFLDGYALFLGEDWDVGNDKEYPPTAKMKEFADKRPELTKSFLKHLPSYVDGIDIGSQTVIMKQEQRNTVDQKPNIWTLQNVWFYRRSLARELNIPYRPYINSREKPEWSVMELPFNGSVPILVPNYVVKLFLDK